MYYRLTYKASTEHSLVGDYVLCGMKPLNIGQTLACDVKISENTDYDSEIFATIIPSDDGKGWYVVCRSDHYRLRVNGQSVTIASLLQNGDELKFIDATGRGERELATLRFDIFNDGDYSASSGVLYKHKPSVARIYVVACLLLAFISVLAVVGYSLKADDESDIYSMDFSSIEPYVCQIITDSVFLDSLTHDGDRVNIAAIALEQPAYGTCFITDSSLLVTARHCIEPWINDESWDGKWNSKNLQPALRLATEAETRNYQLGETQFIVRSHCEVHFGMQTLEYYSTDFKLNKSRDMIACLGDDKHPVYCRTIIPIASRRDMELGDFAYVEAVGITGSPISLATMDDMRNFDMKYKKNIVVLGFPVNDNNTKYVQTQQGVCQHLEWNSDSTLAGCLQMSASINPGNSGGPVFIQSDRELKVVGIVSKADTHSQQGTFWAVPITEVHDLQKLGDKEIEDSIIFRR